MIHWTFHFPFRRLSGLLLSTAWPHKISGEVLSSHSIVSSSWTVRLCSPWGGRWIGHWKTTWSTVCSSAPHSQAAEEAIPHLYKQEWKRPTPVRRRFNRTHTVLGRAIPGEWMPVSSGVARPKIFGGGKMFDFRRITLFCLEKRLSKHKMTIFSKNLGGAWPLVSPLATPMPVSGMKVRSLLVLSNHSESFMIFHKALWSDTINLSTKKLYPRGKLLRNLSASSLMMRWKTRN